MEVVMELLLFRCFLAIHIVSGAIAAISFWVPVIGRKGGVNHKRWGLWFAWAMLTRVHDVRFADGLPGNRHEPAYVVRSNRASPTSGR
jgi:hypothetical protein